MTYPRTSRRPSSHRSPFSAEAKKSVPGNSCD
jgi:hypothetical protein